MKRVPLFLTLMLSAILILSVGCARKPDDAKISSAIQGKFSQDSGLSTKQLTVQADRGVVTLAGFVDDETQRQAASRQAASVDGVKEVVNNLQVGSAPNPSMAAAQPDTRGEEIKSSPSKPKEKRRVTARKDHYYSVQDPATESGSSSSTSVTAENSQPASTPAQVTPADTPPLTPPPPRKVTVEQGTQMTVRLIDSLDSEKNRVGDTFHATLNAPLTAEGSEAIPAGTDITGHIVDLRSAGKFAGQSLLVLQLDSIAVNGRTYNLQTDQYRKEGASRGKNTAEKVGGGAIIGGIIGAIAGGGKGAAIGTAAGAGVGGGVQAASKSQQIKLPSETVLNFTLQAPVTVTKPQDPNAGRQKLGDSQ
jgi:BON domain